MENTPDHPNNADHDNDEVGNTNYVVNIPPQPKGIGTLITAIFAVLISGASAFFAWHQTAIFKDYTRIQNRAYIVVTAVTPYHWDVGDTVRFKVVIKNIGQTPAYNVITRSATMLSPELQENEPADCRVVDKSIWVVAPNDSHAVLGWGDVVLDGLQILFIRVGDLKLFTYFSVTYDDVFDTPHRTVACCQLDLGSESLERKGKFNYQY